MHAAAECVLPPQTSPVARMVAGIASWLSPRKKEVVEIDDAWHQHKWNPAQPAEGRPHPDELSQRYGNPKGLLKFKKELGSGHFGKVFEVVQGASDLPLAVKKMAIEGHWVEKEVENLKHCACEWVVKLVETYYSPEEDRLWILMEKLGPSLETVARQSGDRAFSEACIASIIRQVFCALKEVHARERVHLDVKPGNLLVGKDGNLRLADFGCTQKIGDKCMQEGDADFAAPEVECSVGLYRGENDIWSCGIIILYLAYGEAKVFSRPRWQPDMTYEDLLALVVASGEYRWELLNWCLSPKPEDRPSARQALEHPWCYPALAGFFPPSTALEEFLPPSPPA